MRTPASGRRPLTSGPVSFSRIIAQEAAALLKLNLLFLLFCLRSDHPARMLCSVSRWSAGMPAERTVPLLENSSGTPPPSLADGLGSLLLTVLPLTAAGYGEWVFLHFARDNPVSYLPFAFCGRGVSYGIAGLPPISGDCFEGRELNQETVAIAAAGAGRPPGRRWGGSWYLPLAAAVLWIPLTRGLSAVIGFPSPACWPCFF